MLANLEIGAPSEAVEEEEHEEGYQGAGGVEERVPGEAVREATKDW